MTSIRSAPIRLAVFAVWLAAVFVAAWVIGASWGAEADTVKRSHDGDEAAHVGEGTSHSESERQ